eukprot:g9379.t1
MSRARATAVVVLRSLPLFGWLFVASPTPSFASAAAQEERTASASKVVTVTGESFDRTIRKDTAYFLMLHVSWCGICKRTFPLFEAAAAVNALQTQSAVVFAHADCTDDKVLAKKFGVQGYPAIYYRDELDMDSTRPRQQQESNSNSKGTPDPPEARLFPSVEWGGKGELLMWRKYQGGRTTRSFLEYARRMSARPTARALDAGAGAADDVFAAVEEDRARWARESDVFAGAPGAGGPEGSGNATGASSRENATAASLVNPKPQETAFVLYTLTAPPSPPGKEKTTPDAQLEIDFDRLSKRFRDTNWFYRVTDAKKAGTVEAVVGGDALLATRASPDKRVRVKYEQEELVSAAISTRTKSYARLEAWAANNRYPGTWNVTDKVFAGFVRSGKPALIAVLAPAAMRAPEAQEKLAIPDKTRLAVVPWAHLVKLPRVVIPLADMLAPQSFWPLSETDARGAEWSAALVMKMLREFEAIGGLRAEGGGHELAAALALLLMNEKTGGAEGNGLGSAFALRL